MPCNWNEATGAIETLHERYERESVEMAAAVCCEAHVVEYYTWLDAEDWRESCAAMKRAEGNWEDAGCPTG